MKRFVRVVLMMGALLSSGACAGDGDPFAGMGGEAGSGPTDLGEGGAGSVGPEPPLCATEPPLFATGSPSHRFGSGQEVGQADFPGPVLGAPAGQGGGSGSTDVVSLGDGGTVTLEFEGNFITDGPGPDFIVFENPFLIGGDPESPFAELGKVAVSQDGEHWIEFSCDASSYPFDFCAGWRPVLLTGFEEGSVLDPETAGGDPFDLAEVGLPWVRYVRVTDLAGDDPSVFDLDAVGIVHAGCPNEVDR